MTIVELQRFGQACVRDGRPEALLLARRAAARIRRRRQK